MTEYISRKAAVKAIRERCSPCGEAIEAIRCAPTVDAVVVTRCKDCARYRLGLNGGPENWCGRTGFVRRDDDFCSYGEPKEEEKKNVDELT